MNIDQEKYWESLGRIKKIYEKAKKIIIKAEYIAGNSAISALNELRYALDHLMRIGEPGYTQEDEFKRAEGHVYRAIYDAYEIIFIDSYEKIQKQLAMVREETVALICPKYYTDYRSELNNVIDILTNKRAFHKEIAKNSFDFKIYDDSINKFLEIASEIDSCYPDMVKYDKKIKNRSVMKVIWSLILVIISFFLGLIYRYF